MPYPPPTPWDYAKLMFHILTHWRFWKPKPEKPHEYARPCLDCLHLGNLPRGRCEKCGPPDWTQFETT